MLTCVVLYCSARERVLAALARGGESKEAGAAGGPLVRTSLRVGGGMEGWDGGGWGGWIIEGFREGKGEGGRAGAGAGSRLGRVREIKPSL